MEYILVFKNTNSAIKAEQRLINERLTAGVLPLPSQIGAGCGICLRVKEGDIAAARTALTSAGIDIGVYSREIIDGGYCYTQIKE